MIRIEYIETYGRDAAVRGLRNPMNSWNKSDSTWTYDTDSESLNFIIGKRDLELMKSLVNAGTDHGKFLRMMIVSCDITAPLYWWKEFDTYKVGTVANSCSTMHKIHTKEFTLDDFSYDHLNSHSIDSLNTVISILNLYRDRYNLSQIKDDWWQMIQLLPTSYNQKRTVQMNYAVLRNIVNARKDHKLDEWQTFIKIMLSELPYAKELLLNTEGTKKS